MNPTATDVVLVISAISTAVCAIIAASKSSSSAKSSAVAAVASQDNSAKLDEAKDKLEEVHRTTNGNLTAKDSTISSLQSGNKYLRSIIVELLKTVPNETFEEILDRVNNRKILDPKLKESATFNFRNSE